MNLDVREKINPMGLVEDELAMAEPEFRIEDDAAADWALGVIAEEREERDRLIEICKHKIEQLERRIDVFNERCDSKTGYLESKLLEYFDTVKKKETKTQESYKLVTGSLVLKKSKVNIKHDDAALIKHLAGTEFVESVPKLKWAEYKKQLEVVDGNVINAVTGEIVDGCTAEIIPAEFTVKF